MPKRPVTWRRWHVAAAFLAIGVGAIVAAYYISDEQHRLRHAVARLGVLERSSRRLIAENRDAVAKLETARVAICSLRNAQERQVRASAAELADATEYLLKHPEGAPALGISRAQIQASIDRMASDLGDANRDLEALDLVQCADTPSVGAARSPH